VIKKNFRNLFGDGIDAIAIASPFRPTGANLIKVLETAQRSLLDGGVELIVKYQKYSLSRKDSIC
jgi:hypothetical protein